MKRNVLLIGIGVIIIIFAISIIFRDQIVRMFLSPTQSSVQLDESKQSQVETVASNLMTPWSVAFLPAGDMLVTERSGELTRVGEDGTSVTIDGVQETSEGGLLGVAIDPAFEQNSYIYLYYTTSRDGSLQNQVDRYVYENNDVREREVIIDAIPAASNHNGGAIAFGPDEKLYITTGDAANGAFAQDTDSLAGKILRIEKDGSVPSDNPFDNEVWSYGHRNPQGIAWDGDGVLWSVEHGPSGGDGGRGQDELNKIERGANYGWPTIMGDEAQDGMKTPVAHSGEDDTWAPAGLAFHNGSLYFAGLRGQALYKYDVANKKMTRLFAEEYGRLRAVTAHNMDVYISTSNRDGRGNPNSDDDKILRVSDL